ncbi:ABC transporter permease [Halococcoides cellulosivorans]|uniref:ABC transporter permease n=1 Tax=Halococcoides cellulosivorans TaxID=1679096 RepID=A0A2R4X2T7_9EURY|nr:ABC transporter permease [Halococcoides cellulosivorans]AWB28117.1 ABC transporter permease [Halococcoides cellulosivorans]
MVNYYIKRTGKAALTAYIVMTISFGLSRMLPGNPLASIEGRLRGAGLTEQQVQTALAPYKETIPTGTLLEQYVQYMSTLLTGNLGKTVAYKVSTDPSTGEIGGVSVAGLIGKYMPWTIFIGVTAIIIFYALSLTLGSIMAYYEGSNFDTANSLVAMLASGLPFFVTGIVLIWLFAGIFNVLPAGGKFAASQEIRPGFNLPFIQSALYHSILPIAATVIGRYGVRALAMRGNSISILGKGYVQVAQLRGLPDRIIALRYVGRNAVLPMYTGMLLSFGWIIGGTVVLETVFNYQGLGWLLLVALDAKDYPLLMAIFLVLTLALVVGIYLADLSYGLVDPRITTGEKDAY